MRSTAEIVRVRPVRPWWRTRQGIGSIANWVFSATNFGWTFVLIATSVW